MRAATEYCQHEVGVGSLLCRMMTRILSLPFAYPCTRASNCESSAKPRHTPTTFSPISPPHHYRRPILHFGARALASERRRSGACVRSAIDGAKAGVPMLVMETLPDARRKIVLPSAHLIGRLYDGQNGVC